MPTQLVTIEGNMGTGKTTIARKVASYMPDTQFFAAPDVEQNPYWEAYLKEPKKYALPLQMWFLRERLRVYVAALRHMDTTGESVILDFSLFSDVIFAIMHHAQGYLTDTQLLVYQELFNRIGELELPPPHLSILLQANPTICLQRMETNPTREKQRRMSKDAIGEDYIARVDELYQHRWLHDTERVYTPTWMRAKRVAPDEARLPCAPSRLILVRDWSDLSNVKPMAIADAVYCTEPSDVHTWLGGFRDGGSSGDGDFAMRVRALSDGAIPDPI